jgi:DNA-binding transcriptional ArsR family regulator
MRRMASEGDDEEALKREVRRLGARIGELEALLSRLREPFSKLEDISRNYFRLIELYMRFGEVSPQTAIPGLKDPISREIVNMLFRRSGQNISELTDAVRARRGSASRRIIRARLAELVEKGIVLGVSRRKTVEYSISEEVARKWSEMLGFFKAGDQP